MADILIVGAGAAGLMAAGAAARRGHKVTVLEHTDKPGQKILVTGKGRCNLRQGPLQPDQRLRRGGISPPCADQPPVFVFLPLRLPAGQNQGAV